MQKFLILLTLIISTTSFSQRTYKELMNDPSVNIKKVKKEADKYFETHDKNVKGSGFKGYERWKAQNEYKFSKGKRKKTDPYFAAHAFERFKENNQTNSSFRTAGFVNTWTELGPYRVENVSNGYNAGIGRVEDIYVDPTNSNKIYFGSRSGGFWKTSDGGSTWEGGSTDFITATGVNTIAVSPTNADSILINVQNSSNFYSHGIYRSVNGGTLWVESNFNPTNLGEGGLGSSFRVYDVAYHPLVADLIFIATNQGIYRSTDNLQTWTQPITSGNITEIDFHPTNQNIIYYYNSDSDDRKYVYYSTDGGENFSSSSSLIDLSANDNSSKGTISTSPDCPSCVYFSSIKGVWKSTDEGQSFTALSTTSETDGIMQIAVSDVDTSYMINGYVDTYRSTNGGKTFSKATYWNLSSFSHGSFDQTTNLNNSQKYVHADLRTSLCVNGVFYIGTDGFVSKSTDNGSTWEIINQNTSTRENYRLGVSQSNHYLTITGSQDNGTSIRKKDGWLEYYGADGMEGIIHPLNDDWMIGSSQYGDRYQTKDQGSTSTTVTPSGGGGRGFGSWIAPILMDPNDHMRLYQFSFDVFRSDNFGTNWTKVSATQPFSKVILVADIANNNSNIMLATPFTNKELKKTTDGGVTWFDVKGTLPDETISDIAFDPNDDDVIIITYATWANDGDKVFLTTDGGSNWTNITYNLQDMPIRSVVIDHTSESNIYLGGEIGIYTKPMSSNSWSLYNSDLPNTSILELEVVNATNVLRAATWGRGLWENALVGKKDYPSIIYTNITDNPTDYTPFENEDQFITSTISYENTISSVFVKWSAGSPTFDQTISMSNTSDSTWVSDTYISNQEIDTKIYFKVCAVGDNNDTTETYKFMYTVKDPEYCTGSANAVLHHINNVELNGISNVTVSDEGYGDYSSTYIPLYEDSTYTLTCEISQQFTFSGQESINAWIDFDNDKVFDNDEKINMAAFSSTSDKTSTGTFTVPSLLASDTVIMRVSHGANSSDPCNTAGYGEVEDYSIILKKICHETNENVVSCSYYWNSTNTTYNTTGEYTATLTDANGCDSIVTLNLTIEPLNLTITQNSNSLSSNQAGATYQWVECNFKNTEIFGATSQTFTATSNGEYALVVSKDGCTETTDCYEVNTITNSSNLSGELITDFTVYPNPTEGDIAIDLGENKTEINLYIYNSEGKLLLEKLFYNQQFLNFNLDGPKGLYQIAIQVKTGYSLIPVILK